MKPDRRRIASPAVAPEALEAALEKTHEVKEKVEAFSEDMAVANESKKRKIVGGATTLSAAEALQEGQAVEEVVEEVAGDLHEVTDTLAQGIEDLEQVELALDRARSALAQTESALASAQVEERRATLRAMHDAATGLPNRGLFDDRLAHGISLADRHGWNLAVMFLDLDRFKSINDTHGHAAGDRVLKEVAQRLLQDARDEDTVCRNGGDEFLVLLMNPQARVNVERMARAVLRNIAHPIEIGGQALVIRSSIGIALYPDDGSTGAQLVAHADRAMYRAKKDLCGYALYRADVDGPAG